MDSNMTPAPSLHRDNSDPARFPQPLQMTTPELDPARENNGTEIALANVSDTTRG